MAIDCAQALASPLMQQIIRVESGGNPFAIGVVGDALQRQPKNETEAVATSRMLEARGFNYSIGIGQVNKVHFPRLGWVADLPKGFNDCQNVLAATDILLACQTRATNAGYSAHPHFTTADGVKASASDVAALSCYYSGDLRAGTRLGYPAKVLRGISMPDAPGGRGKTAANEFLMMAD